MILGIDLDNTLVDYDRVFCCLAEEAHVPLNSLLQKKSSIRECVRAQPDGEKLWRRLQGQAYGPRMVEAILYPGALEFIQLAAGYGVPIYIISHKTEYSVSGESHVSLREVAIEWLVKRRIMGDGFRQIQRSRVHFEGTRTDKIRRIASVGCTHFIDDLPELFEDPTFPGQVERLLFSPHGHVKNGASDRVYASWEELRRFLLPSDVMSK